MLYKLNSFLRWIEKNRFFILAVLLLAVVRIQVSFLNYLDFRYDKIAVVNAKVVNQYKKKNKNYYVLKLKNKSLSFYTTSRDDLKNLLNENVTLNIITNKVAFFDYLFTFYAPSFNLRLNPLNPLEYYIEKQHKTSEMSNLFKALFLGESLEYETRQKLSTLGISHLVALSGLHLGFVSVFIYFVLLPFYSFFHKRHPYRNRYADLGILILVLEFAYLYVTSFPPSLLRAYVLEIVVFLYAFYLSDPFKLKVLGSVLVFSFILFGFKVFSLGFFLSMAGVYYIYLYFRHVKMSLLSTLFLSFYMFGAMFVISHVFFGNFNLYQLFSPFANIAFSVFYPLEAFLHLIGLGGVFDTWIEKYLSFGEEFKTVVFPHWALFFYIFLSLWAFFSKRLFYGINLISLAGIIYAIGV